MIITQKKPMEELMAMVGDAKTVAIVGCNSCATACHTGGEPEVQATGLPPLIYTGFVALPAVAVSSLTALLAEPPAESEPA